jgi:hypothetical protein
MPGMACVERHVDVRDLIRDFTREVLASRRRARGEAPSHITYDNEYETAVNMRTPSPEPPASANDTAPATGEGAATDVDEITPEASGDKPLGVRSGVVAPAGHFLITDGAPYDGEYVAAQKAEQAASRSGASPQP